MINKYCPSRLAVAFLATSLNQATAGDLKMIFNIKPYETVLNEDIQRGDKNSESFKKLKKRWETSSPIPLYRLKVVTFYNRLKKI